MSEAQDPERLLADALRAQARSAPPSDAAPGVLPSGYGLLSGADASSLERERAALEPPTAFQSAPLPPVPAPAPKVARGSIPAYWVLLLAVLLGLATGSVIGLITLMP